MSDKSSYVSVKAKLFGFAKSGNLRHLEATFLVVGRGAVSRADRSGRGSCGVNIHPSHFPFAFFNRLACPDTHPHPPLLFTQNYLPHAPTIVRIWPARSKLPALAKVPAVTADHYLVILLSPSLLMKPPSTKPCKKHLPTEFEISLFFLLTSLRIDALNQSSVSYELHPEAIRPPFSDNTLIERQTAWFDSYIEVSCAPSPLQKGFASFLECLLKQFVKKHSTR
ncbi:hypothetical protein BDK51DRAFT_32091 [Blyttiomyces helicus]|uniref:Uncharacterized protein n=1 Tax=Blyttiomyces helicus TaxID=388810 RepID=A0A4P9WHR6_9FUNG|nr:hypothetical protein BDK51DRAFT_32091 [Blyttiomyces helicus]|eukprot:RKO90978.1 hypothetical protein BDK51DRAFT_32091 [Blyttiomyces helicus]